MIPLGLHIENIMVKELEEIYLDLVVTYFDCHEYVDHETMGKSIDEVLVKFEKLRITHKEINDEEKDTH